MTTQKTAGLTNERLDYLRAAADDVPHSEIVHELLSHVSAEDAEIANWKQAADHWMSRALTAESSLETIRATLDRLRYAVDFAEADSWDGGPDIVARFAWAMVGVEPLSPDQTADIAGRFHTAYPHIRALPNQSERRSGE